MQRGTPRESDTASRREEACLLNPCNVVAQLVTSQSATVDFTLTCFSYTDVLGPSRIVRKELASSTVHSVHLHIVCRFPLLQKKYEEIYRLDCLIGNRNSGRIWLMKVLQLSLGETRSREIKTLPSSSHDPPMEPRAKWNRVRVNTVYVRTFRSTQIVICA